MAGSSRAVTEDHIAIHVINELANLPPLSRSRCIYRVPARLRRQNESAYTPRVVSIGPLHHGKDHLKPMEEHKKRYLRDFLSRTQVNLLSHYMNKVKDQEVKLRSYYAEVIDFPSDQFVRMVLVDAAFLIEYLLRRCYPSFRNKDDYLFHSPWMLNDIKPDLRMLENQLPFFILEELFDLAKQWGFTVSCSITTLSCFVFKSPFAHRGNEDGFEGLHFPEGEVKHFVDLIRTLCLPLEPKAGGELKNLNTPSMTELHQAGIKFEVGTTTNLFDIRFAKGIMEIPKILIADSTEVIIRNQIAFEQCHYTENYLCDYFTVMDWFVSTPKDAELLIKYGVIENFLSDHAEVSTLINSLGMEL